MKSRTLAAVAAIATALSGLAMATPASAGATQPPQLSIYTSSITVHTSNGKQWSFGLSTFQAGPSDQFSEHLTRTVSGGSENHYWDVPLPTSALKFNRSTGHGTLKTPTSTAPLTTINLNFSATRHRSIKCQSGSETDYSGNLSGRATLITHLNGGGTVGGRHVSFKAGTTHLFVDNNCVQSFPTNNQCSNSIQFDDIAPHQHSIFGFSAGTSRFIQVAHNVAIAHPAGATRSDSASARPSSAPVFSKASKTLKVSGSSSGVVTGAGRIVAHTLGHSTASCKHKGVTHTQDQVIGDNGKFTNTSGHPLVGHMSLGGRITVANGGSASFDVEHWH
jgi:hypothetical protein